MDGLPDSAQSISLLRSWCTGKPKNGKMSRSRDRTLTASDTTGDNL